MNYRLYSRVHLGENSYIGDYAIVGLPPSGVDDGELETVIGANAVIRSHSVIYAGNVIGDNFQTGHGVLIRGSNRIGSDVSIGSHSVVEHHVRVGDRVRIHSQAFICEYSELEEGCWIGPRVAFTNALHPQCPRVKECLRGPRVGANARIGANATLLPAVSIGWGAVVGAGAVVVKDVPANCVVVGNPARIIKHKDELVCPYGLVARPYED